MKTRQRMTITNDNKENKNMINNILQPRFGILSNKTIVSKV